LDNVSLDFLKKQTEETCHLLNKNLNKSMRLKKIQYEGTICKKKNMVELEKEQKHRNVGETEVERSMIQKQGERRNMHNQQ
jgi:hypothetical protein